MKIAIITIHNANNYGAILQTFALQQTLKKFGDVEVINYKNRHISISYDLIRIKFSYHGVLGAGKDIFRLIPRYKAIKKFQSFVKNNVHLTRSVSRTELQNEDIQGYDLYVAGSDQIWNPKCVTPNGVFDYTYLLDFVPDCKGRISYASSAGGYSFSEKELNDLVNHLNSFSSISVREKSLQSVLSKSVDKEVKHVLDPTLLLNKDEWRNIVGSSTAEIKSSYILLYSVPKLDLIRPVVDYFSKELGMNVVSLDQGLKSNANVDQQVRDAGPADFISLFSNASFVITDSFHGVCFSLIFGLPFVAVSSGVHKSRIESLLILLNAEDRLIQKYEDLDTYNSKPVDFDVIDKQRQKSLEILESSVSNVVGQR